MTDWFAQPLTTLAFVWRIERADGVAVGFTSHDRDLTRDGFLYRAAPGMVPSAIERSESLVPDDVSLSGALTSGAFREGDLIAGRWDGAALVLSAVDWSDAAAMPVVLARGSFGAVEVRDGAFSVALRGAAAVFDMGVVEATSPECRAELGDKRCRVDLRGRRAVVVVAAASGEMITLQASPGGSGEFASGTLAWTDGANAGLRSRVAAQVGVTLTLVEIPPFGVAAGDRGEMVQGCDKRFSTCSGRFSNAINFRGEPHLPGNDLLTRYGD